MNHSTPNVSKSFPKRKLQFLAMAVLAFMLAGCAGSSTPTDQSSANTGSTDNSPVDNSGLLTEQTTQQSMTGQPPTEGWSIHMNAKKLLPGNQSMAVDKYCKTVAGGMMECQIYEDTNSDSRLIGIEAMVDAPTYNTFTPQEKQSWLPTKDLMSATFATMPDLDQQQFDNVAQSLANNYSKIYLLWDPSKLDLPSGNPMVTIMNATVGTGTTAPVGGGTTANSGTPASSTGTPAPATTSAQSGGASGGFSLGTFNVSQMVASGLQQKKSNYESSVLQTTNVGSLQLVALKSSIASHTYANTTQLIYIVSGSGEFTLNGKKEPVSAGMLVVIPNGTSQAYQNLGGASSPLVYVTLKTPFDDTDVKWGS